MSEILNFICFFKQTFRWLSIDHKTIIVSFTEYLKGVLSQVLDSYEILLELKDKSGELEIIKKELLKINGLLQVTINKIEAAEKNSDDFVRYLKSLKFYLENNDFEREIEIMGPL